MPRSFRLPFVALAAVAVLSSPLLFGCAGVEDETVASSEDELRVLTKSEIVGTIAFGQTKRVQYKPTPRYRALSFQANAGDEVEIWVRGVGSADARAFLLHGSFATIAANDDATANTRDARIATTLTSSGKYYIAMREMDEETSPVSDFDVTLTRTNVPPPPPPPPPATSPFDAASCSGAALGHASIVSMFPPGTVGMKKFPGTVHGRLRTCTELGGCSSWQETNTVRPKHRWVGCEQQRKACTSDSANLLVEFRNASSPFWVGLELKTSDFPNSGNEAWSPYDANGHISLGNLWAGGNTQNSLNMETQYGSFHSPGIPFEIDVRESCYRAVSKQTHVQGPQLQTELEIVVLGKITN